MAQQPMAIPAGLVAASTAGHVERRSCLLRPVVPAKTLELAAEHPIVAAGIQSAPEVETHLELLDCCWIERD